MELPEMAILLTCIGVVVSKDTGKTIKSIPTISNSLVNLGKMDFSFYFNTKGSESSIKSELLPANSFHFSKSEPILEESCPCSSIRNIKDSFLSNPSGILNKILTNNELFTFTEPMTSKFCCESHEHIQEETAFFDLGLKPQIKTKQSNPFSFPTFAFENLPKSKLSPPSLPVPPLSPKAIEIFFFPKKKEFSFDFSNVFPKKNDIANKDAIKIVGDKELRNDFKNFKLNTKSLASSVKKDLTTTNDKNIEKNLKKEPNNKEDVQKVNATIDKLNQL